MPTLLKLEGGTMLGASMSIAFLMCVERGPLESQSILCVESLRRYGGALAASPVFAFAPRRGQGPDDATVRALSDLGASVVAEPLNAEHAAHPTWNKVYAAAWAERELSEEILVFTDSDCVFLGEPAELARGEWQAAAKPVGVARAASAGAGDEAEEWWRRMYQTAGVRSEPFVTTAVDRVRVRAYWNAGLVAARRSAGVFGAWRSALEALVAAGCVHPKPELMDQMSLATALADRHEQVWELPDPYNYPLPQRARLSPQAARLELGELVHAHLHRWAHVAGFLSELEPPLDRGAERYVWLDERLPLEPLQEDSFRRVQQRRLRRSRTQA